MLGPAVHIESAFNRWVQMGSADICRSDVDKSIENICVRGRSSAICLRKI